MTYKESLKRWIKHTEDNNQISYQDYLNYLLNNKYITHPIYIHFFSLYKNQRKLIQAYWNTNILNKPV